MSALNAGKRETSCGIRSHFADGRVVFILQLNINIRHGSMGWIPDDSFDSIGKTGCLKSSRTRSSRSKADNCTDEHQSREANQPFHHASSFANSMGNDPIEKNGSAFLTRLGILAKARPY